jgi:hypothetical protein
LVKIGLIGLFELTFHKQFMQSNLLERMNAQNLQSSVEASEQFQFLLQDGYQQICRHSDPNLSFYHVEARYRGQALIILGMHMTQPATLY